MFTRFSRLHDLVLSSNSNMCLTPCWRADQAVSLKGSEWSTPFLFTSSNSPMKVQQGCDGLRSCSHWNYDLRRMTCQPGTPSPTCEKSAQIHLEWASDDIQETTVFVFRWADDSNMPRNNSLETNSIGSGSIADCHCVWGNKKKYSSVNFS